MTRPKLDRRLRTVDERDPQNGSQTLADQLGWRPIRARNIMADRAPLTAWSAFTESTALRPA